VETLRKNMIHAETIGEFLPSPEKRLIIRENGKTGILIRPVADELWQALRRSPIP